MAEAWDAIASGYALRAAPFTASFAPDLLGAAFPHVDTSTTLHAHGHDDAAPSTCSSSLALLDVAAGSGAVALLAAKLPAVSQVLATDISPSMLAELEDRAATLSPSVSIETTPCDCTALPLADNTFDAAVSNFGVIFATDVRAGLNEMVRVTKPGGRVAFTSWGKTPAFTEIEDTWRAILPASAPAGHTSPQAAEDVAISRVRQQLADIPVLDDITVEAIEHELVVDSPEAYWERMLVRPPAP